MSASHLPLTDLLDALRSAGPADALEHPLGGAVVVDVSEGEPPADLDALVHAASTLPCVIVGAGSEDGWHAALCDVLVAPDHPDLEAVLATVAARPLASSALAVLLRDSTGRSVGAGLAAESATYSALQCGPEFAAWRAANPVRGRPADGRPTVAVVRQGPTLTITLSRPAVHNALDARMRDELLDALAVAVDDMSIEEVVLTGAGPSFCSGGDLDEFGTRPDPATAHLVRLARSPGRLVASLAPRVTAKVHGACVGSGIEIAAFARRVVARPDTVIALPELSMGLVPGAGGTVSLPQRIGRHHTALLALSGARVDAGTALRWGLVDAIED